ncbi:hypothetical protein B296_00052146 [Ensete ventricosum]|uniref:ABC-2 type transporter transmembrane domain-containing protein n=1 Tax=Ensete ventricosum TaxID=4639 RepID=A0A426X6L2_ENSVE|nr:hypothetical protein B296_00052146 [Ensete ventricosum]
MVSSSRWSWRGCFRHPTDVLRGSGAEEGEAEENLKWAALEKLPTYDRMRKGILRQVVEDGRVVCDEVDVNRLAPRDRKLLLDRIFRMVEEDNERFLERLRHRIDRLLLFLQESLDLGIIGLLHLSPSKKRTIKILNDVSGILKPASQLDLHNGEMTVRETLDFSGRCLGVGTRKGIPDFLQEVTSKKDQEQYWSNKNQYHYISVSKFVQLFKSFHVGKQLSEELSVPYDKSRAHPAALTTQKYGISNWELLKACLSREWLLMKRNSFVYVFKTFQITILSFIAMTVFLRTKMPHKTIPDGNKFHGALFYSLINVMFNGMAELSMTIYKLPVFYKQRDFLFYPPWAFGLSYGLLKIPLSLLDTGIWIILTYYAIGFAPAAGR